MLKSGDLVKKLVKQTYPYLINIFIVMVVMLLTFVLSNTSPFGENVLGKSDAIVQFKPLLYDFIMGIKTHSLESFSFNNGLGNPTIFNFLYYLSSPFNLIALIFDESDAMYLSTIFLKTFIASITMTFDIKKKNEV